MLLHSSAALREIFPETKQTFIYPGSAECDFQEAGFYFISASCSQRLPNNFLDCSVNIDSFQEMTEEQVNGYINLVQEKSKHDSPFLNINRRKYLRWEVW